MTADAPPTEGSAAVAPGFTGRWWRRPATWRLALWLLISVVMLRPTPHRVGSTVAGDLGDSMFLTWTLSWGAHGLRHDPLGVFDANIFHPNDQMLAFSDPMLSIAPVYGAVHAITGDRVAALNLVMIGLFVIALAGGYSLGHRILGRSDVAIVVAIVFACNGYVFGQQNHPQIQTLGLLPLAFVALFRAVEHRRARDGVVLAVATVVITLANLTFGAIWFVSGTVALGVLAVRGRLRPWSSLLRPAVPAAVGTALVLGPIGLVYRGVADTHALQRSYEPANSLLITDVITPQRDNWLWGTALDGFNSVGKAGEHGAFPGLLALALAGVGLALFISYWSRRPSAGNHPAGLPDARMDELLAVVLAALLAVALAAGPSPGGLPGPFRFFHAYVPGFESIRATARFTIVVFLGAALLVGWAVAWVARAVPERWGRAVVPVVAVVILAEVWGPMARVEVPEGDRLLVYEAIAEMEPGAVLELPIHSPVEGVEWAFVEAPRMFHATSDFNVRVNGYSGHAPLGFDTVATVLNTYPSADAVALIEELEVRYVVLHTGLEQGYAALAAGDAAEIVSRATGQGHEASRHGEDWLIDLG